MAIYQLDGQAPELPADGNYFVADTATVIGKVRLLSSASVWFGAVLRGDNEWIEIGENSNVQDNSTCGSIVGAGSVITEGKQFPEHSLIIGAPARVIRTLEPAQVAAMGGAAKFYVGNAPRFKKGLKKIG